MSAVRRDEAIAFLQKAANALLAAQLLAEAKGEMAQSLFFHTEQAAEDALRGFLAAHGEPVKGKNLAALLSQCAAVNPAFKEIQLIKTDYPETALKQSKRIYDTVKTHLPAEIKAAM
ncbi:MAG: HEPN domain-containing protein [Bacteroidota bacterium]